MNNVRTQNRYGTKIYVTFPDYPTFKLAPQWFRLTQEQGKHDVMEISFGSYDKHFIKVLKTGVTVEVKWTTEHAKGKWVGYAHSSEPITQASLKKNLVIKATGASFRLKEGGNKIWKNKTAPEIVADICKQHKLKVVTDTSGIRFGMQSLVGHTYWEKILELGDRIGFHAHVHGTTLYFQRIDKLIDQCSSVIPVMSYNDGTVNAGAVFEGQTLDYFKAKVGDLHEMSEHQKKNKTVHGIDPITGKKHSQTAKVTKVGKSIRESVSDALFKEVIPTVVADVKTVAKELAEGFAHLSRFSLHAEGTGQGDPKIAPYKTIEINGTGQDTDGFWVIKRVEHFATMDGRYSVEFTCMSDGTGKNKGGKFRTTKATVVPTRNVAYEMATGGKQAEATPTLSARTPLLKQTDGGFISTVRRWEGR